MLIWTNFDRFAITNLSSLLQKFHLPIEVMLHSLQTQKTSTNVADTNFHIIDT